MIHVRLGPLPHVFHQSRSEQRILKLTYIGDISGANTEFHQSRSEQRILKLAGGMISTRLIEKFHQSRSEQRILKQPARGWGSRPSSGFTSHDPSRGY